MTYAIQKKPTLPVQQNTGGKIPPQAIEFEKVVLGALMLEREALVLVGASIRPSIMYLDRHRLITESIMELYSNGDPVDILTVSDHLRKKGKLEECGGAVYITELTSKVSSADNIEFHTRIIQETHIKREAIKTAHEIIQMAYDDQSDCFEIIEKQQNDVIGIISGIDNGNTQTLREIGREAMEEIATAMSNKGKLIGIPTGFKKLDEIVKGWQQPDLIILAARPAMGKTSLAINWVCNAAKQGFPVSFFSLEMSKSQLFKRILAQETHMKSSSELQAGEVSEGEFNKLSSECDRIFGYNMHIDDTAELSITALRSKAYRMKTQHGIKMIVVDYLQLMSAKGSGNREQEISAIARGLKKIAKELKIPVIALAQLSRAVETRGGDKRPNLSDLRESGAIEQDADIIMFLYRAEYYGIMEDSNGNSTQNMGEIMISKHRNGALGSVFTKFFARYTDFKDEDVEERIEKIEKAAQIDHDYSRNTNIRAGLSDFDTEPRDPNLF
ncbi:replicative DNA helicase [Pleomorphovibrio marinus]|uniref:replicative DNA helicase n=1 Tax=Pleomorphovibrio marinus TaxID=2164132 RepID=UPI000E0BC872|nr:replicative DNA helicase [Pleomorphovibrio marinus]